MSPRIKKAVTEKWTVVHKKYTYTRNDRNGVYLATHGLDDYEKQFKYCFENCAKGSWDAAPVFKVYNSWPPKFDRYIESCRFFFKDAADAVTFRLRFEDKCYTV